MKKRILLCFLLLFMFPLCGMSAAQSIKTLQPKGYVNDFADVIPHDIETQVAALISHVEHKTSAEISVVTILDLDGMSIESYAVSLFEQWGIGKKGKDNGVLLVVAPRQRKVRIEVGYGLEGALPDGLCGEIIDRAMLPFFKSGNYGKGILQGVVNISAVIGKEYNVNIFDDLSINGNLEAPVVQRSKFKSVVDALVYIALMLLFFGGRFWFFPLLFGYPFGGYWSGGGSYRGGGAFSSGFGGFGGGFSGGGGASSSW